MKDTFTIKEISEGAELSRQRIHALIRSGKIPAIQRGHGKPVQVKWKDLLNAIDNRSILAFLLRTLSHERMLLETAYDNLQEIEKAIRFAKAIRYAMIMAEGAPEIGDKDRERVHEWIKATSFFNDLTAFENPYLDKHKKDEQ